MDRQCLVVAVESIGSSIPEANFNLSKQLNNLVGHRAPDGYDGFVSGIESVTMVNIEYDEFTQTYELVVLAIVETAPL